MSKLDDRKWLTSSIDMNDTRQSQAPAALAAHSCGERRKDATTSKHPLKRARIADRVSDEATAFGDGRASALSTSFFSTHDAGDACVNTSSVLTTELDTCPWRLPRAQTLTATVAGLNAQLEHVAVLSSMIRPRAASTCRTSTSAYEDDVARMCTVELTHVAALLAVGTSMQTQQQETAEHQVRDMLDLVSYLLYVHERGCEQQETLSEQVSTMTKHVARKTHIVHTLQSDLETLRHDQVQRENRFRATEQALLTEKKTLQMEKKRVEVNCARYVPSWW